MTNKSKYLSKNILMTAIILLVILFVPSSFVLLSDPGRPEGRCFVSPGQTVVEWKSKTPCMQSIAGVCILPIIRRHVSYKVTVTEGIPLRDRHGNVIPETNGERRDWLTYDSTAWNTLQNDSFWNRYINYEPIAADEYVVMVQTRYRLFNNVVSTLGICTQQP